MDEVKVDLLPSYSDGTKKNCTIANFLAGKNIFMTGATGFLGQCLIERLLSATPKIGKIYVLVRSKNGYSPESRIARLMAKSLFDNLNEDDKLKVLPIVGELTEPNFGIKDEMLQKLYDEVNIVYHVAATIRFNSYIGTSIKINLVGTKVAIDFAKSLKRLASFIYVSTAFCNSCYLNENIKEQVYPTERDPYDMMKLVDSNNNQNELPQTGTKELQELLLDHPNTYTFTKQLAENLIARELQGFPAGIIRPSIVYGTAKYPHPGWVGSANNGHIGFVAGYSKGLFRTMGGDPSSVMDLIPSDYVANATIVLSWYVGTRPLEQVEVIHCTSGEINPLTFGKYCKILNAASKKHPNDFIICQPKVKVRNGFRYKLFIYLFHFLPALIFWLPEHFLSSVNKPARKTLDYVKIFDNGIKAFDYFTSRNFHYQMKNSLRILECLEPDDAKLYNYNVKYCDWRLYMESQLQGIRYFFYKESKETTTWHRVMWHMYGLVQFLWYVAGFFLISMVNNLMYSPSFSTAWTICFLIFLKWI